MARYIVTYDLNKPGQNYEELIELIESYSSAVEIGRSSWVIASSNTPAQIRDYLESALDPNDTLLVGVPGLSAAWGLSKDGVFDRVKALLKE